MSDDTVTLPRGLARATLDALRDLIRESRDPGTGTLGTEWLLAREVEREPGAAPDSLDVAMADVRLERARQEAKWGEQNHDPFAYLTILMEEVGELAQAALHTRYGGRAGGLARMREEAVQAAAVAVAIVECLDRGKWRWGGHAAPGEPQERVVGVLHEAAIECGRPSCSWCYRQAGRP